MASVERAERPRAIRVWSRAGLYSPFAVAFLYDLTLARASQVRVPGLVVFLLLSAGQAGACAVLLHASVSRYLARGPAPRRWLVAAAIALTAAGVLAGAAAFPAFTRPPGTAFPVSMLVAMLLGGTLTVALAPLLRRPRCSPWCSRARPRPAACPRASAGPASAPTGRRSPGHF